MASKQYNKDGRAYTAAHRNIRALARRRQERAALITLLDSIKNRPGGARVMYDGLRTPVSEVRAAATVDLHYVDTVIHRLVQEINSACRTHNLLLSDTMKAVVTGNSVS